ncbi:PIR Superfamily Protein [Plasmodium ovale wallikeri]|uniref:PIR Superfamily Protein n=1 Tax=Plasmodium ovale wallikeri TaxID=864142 RepID=A0A1A9AP21_PLAOA|nr:PIR Superfamily Protein [Plasmodium ovale wallikeri]SBT57969.1 PIR Superfamily Protein [Plasmodium ovale wallikeri]
MTLTKDENYELCDKFPDYLKLEASFFTNKEELGKFNEECAMIEREYLGKFTNCKDVCAKFKCIAIQFLSVFESDEYDSANGFSFLNFWLNYQLMNIPKSIVSARQFYDKLKVKDHGFDSENKLIDKIYVIEKEHLENMAMLYKLYEKYNAIHDIIKNTDQPEKNCSDYPEECTQLFEKANKNCSTNNVKFCRALETFKTKYEYMFKDTEYENCKLHKTLTLTNYIDQDEDLYLSTDSYTSSGDQGINSHFRSIIIVIFTVISFFSIFLILYKATPFGIYFRRQIRRVKEKWINLEYINENKSILQNIASEQLNEENNQLRIPYY